MNKLNHVSNWGRFLLFLIVIGILSFPRQTQAATLFLLNEGNGGKYSSLALDSNGIPVMSYQDTVGGSNLALLRCNSATYCDEPSIVILDDTSSFRYTSLALDSNDIPVVSYYDEDDGELELARCDTPTCNNVTITTVESAGNPGLYDSLALDSNDLPIISHIDGPNANLELVFCIDLICSSHSTQILDDNGFSWTSLELDSSGKPVVAYSDGNNDLKVAQCNDTACNTVTITILDSTTNAGGASLELANGNIPVVSYFDGDGTDLELARCSDAACSTVNRTTVDSAGRVGEWSSIGLDSNQIPIISYFDSTNGDANLAVCNDLLCSSPDISVFDFFPQEVGSDTSLVVDGDKPIFTFNADSELALYNGKNNVPLLTKNTAIVATTGLPFTLRNTALNTIDLDNIGPEQILTYTVVTAPEQGALNLSTFTQEQIDANAVTYTYNGVRSDGFSFTVSDGEVMIGPFFFGINLSAPSAAPTRNFLVTDLPTLTWNAVSYATEYELEVNKISPSNPPFSYSDTFSASTLSHTLPNPLSIGVYSWRVRGRISPATWGPYSTPLTFAVDP